MNNEQGNQFFELLENSNEIPALSANYSVKRKELVELLNQKPVDIDNIINLLDNGDLSPNMTFDSLLKRENKDIENLLVWAIKNKKRKLIDRLIDDPQFDINFKLSPNYDLYEYDYTSKEEFIVQYAIFYAMYNGDDYTKNKILNRVDFDPSVINLNGKDILMNVLDIKGDLYTINKILDKNLLNINYKDNNERTYWSYAARANNEKAFEKIIMHKNADVNQKSVFFIKSWDDYDFLTTKLILAIEKGYRSSINYLLNDSEIDINFFAKRFKDPYTYGKHGYQPAIAYAVEKNDIDTVKKILSLKKLNLDFSINPSGELEKPKPFWSKVFDSSEEMVLLFFEDKRFKKIIANNLDGFLFMTIYNDYSIVLEKIINENNIDLNKKIKDIEENYTYDNYVLPIEIAALVAEFKTSKKTKCISLLLDSLSKYTEDGKNIRKILSNGYINADVKKVIVMNNNFNITSKEIEKFLKELIEENRYEDVFDIFETGRYALNMSNSISKILSRKFGEYIERFLNSNYSLVDSIYINDIPLISHLIKKGDNNLIKKALTKNDVDINKVDKNGIPDVFKLINNNNYNGLKMFIKRERLDVNLVDSAGRNVLIHAIDKKDEKSLDIIYPKCSDILNAKDAIGRNALMHAIINKNKYALNKLCLDPSIDVFTEDEKGNTAFDYTKKSLFYDAQHIILELEEKQLDKFDFSKRKSKIKELMKNAYDIKEFDIIYNLVSKYNEIDNKTCLEILNKLNEKEEYEKLDKLVNLGKIEFGPSNIDIISDYISRNDENLLNNKNIKMINNTIKNSQSYIKSCSYEQYLEFVNKLGIILIRNKEGFGDQILEDCVLKSVGNGATDSVKKCTFNMKAVKIFKKEDVK